MILNGEKLWRYQVIRQEILENVTKSDEENNDNDKEVE